MCWASGNGVSPSGVWRGEAWPGEARRGKAGQGVGHRRWHGGLRLSLPPSQGWTWRSSAGRGWEGKDMARRGTAWAADSSTEPLRRFPAALIRGQFWRGSIGQSRVWRGEA
jgi:hypothetical protein